ncbi:hypothetical protein HKX54_11355 [Sulfitobacter sp. M57]|uniref:hypothetical protein n=1 Tax=unclassified Sulfitobacter TaxID=196795 RepID=UPI0023E204FA|nr:MULTISPECIES: hypothetical protein [unclassified Sulfitobacter]MDF3415053.1 hypothetical protein [Sulfitobacter sp. KE5]MDF3422534.1 hypothetical protein [Sulfitobacter sp. KE43]MDF3433599.1 hypothetical protein [Sulfitobacter sp. KE42]MDF3459239.1 hypothetical protein [Sulfitobacter sp. S74]MDF3463138.1 hypothetical protein [Sulfitobacter sp. Ks18]
MSVSNDQSAKYRTAELPGLGQVQIPQGMTDEEVLAQVLGAPAEVAATPAKKTKKKP